MERLVFGQELRSGIRDIDKHHALLFKLGNRVLFPSEGKRVSATKTVRRLVDYTAFHFAAEEFVMDQMDYPRADSHEKWHARLTSEIKRIERMVRADGATRANRAQLHLTLDDWLRMHILGADLQFAQFLRAQRREHNVLLPTLEHLMKSGFRASETMEMSIVRTEGVMDQAEIRARRARLPL